MPPSWLEESDFMTSTRLTRINDLVKEMSFQDDPDRLVRVFNQQSDLLLRRDGIVTVNCRDLAEPRYRITRSWRWPDTVNPWTEAHRLPVFEHGILSDLIYRGRVLRDNRFQVPADDPAREHLEGMGSMICAPGYDHGRAVHSVLLLRREPDSFTDQDLETLLLHANLLGRAATNLQLAQQLQEVNRRLDHEMQEVGRMQTHLLPAELPQIEGLELGASYITCHEAGGDYYDVFALPEDQWGLFLADVSGHGTPAAVVMAMMHTLLHSFCGPLAPPAKVLAHLNNHLARAVPEGMFATAVYGVYDARRRRLRYATAGHPAPRLRRSSGPIRALDTTGGLPLAVLPDHPYAELEVSLKPGEVVLFYTDGILEGMNGAGEYFGTGRLDDALALGPLRAGPLVRHLERRFKDFCNGLPDMDDRTLLAAVAVP
jgi:sigma-B regulation protein RsbU (phosphoserine phosphatase)